MNLAKDIWGRGISAAVTLAVFGAPIAAMFLAAEPQWFAPSQVELYVYEPASVVAFGLSADLFHDDAADDADDDEPPAEAAEAIVEGAVEAPVVERLPTPVAVAPTVGDEPPSELSAPGDVLAGVRRGGPLAGAPPSVVRARVAVPASKGRPARKRCQKEYAEIRQLGEQRYEIDGALVRHYSSSIKAFNSLGYSRANDDRDVKGWFISGFGCDDVLHHAGLRRGDIIQTINGRKTNSLTQVFLMYQTMKHRKSFEVRLLRRGKPIVFVYDVLG